LIHNVCYHALQDHKRKEKSPIAGDLSPEPQLPHHITSIVWVSFYHSLGCRNLWCGQW